MANNKVITGTGDKRRFDVVKGAQDTRAIRCTVSTCKNVAQQVPDGKGGTQYKCIACGTTFKHTQL